MRLNRCSPRLAGCLRTPVFVGSAIVFPVWKRPSRLGLSFDVILTSAVWMYRPTKTEDDGRRYGDAGGMGAFESCLDRRWRGTLADAVEDVGGTGFDADVSEAKSVLAEPAQLRDGRCNTSECCRRPPGRRSGFIPIT